jgi:hypothetical protein
MGTDSSACSETVCSDSIARTSPRSNITTGPFRKGSSSITYAEYERV